MNSSMPSARAEDRVIMRSAWRTLSVSAGHEVARLADVAVVAVDLAVGDEGPEVVDGARLPVGPVAVPGDRHARGEHRAPW